MKKFKSNIFSVIFGKAEKPEEHTEAAGAPIDQADESVSSMEADNTRITEENVRLNASVQQLTEQLATATAQANTAAASVADLTNQISTLTAERDALATEKQSLTEQLAAKPTGQLTTVVANPEKEEAIAGDNTKKEKSFRTPHDAQVDEYLKASSPNLK